jgi:DNA-binding transcriptional ArsR family regulator
MASTRAAYERGLSCCIAAALDEWSGFPVWSAIIDRSLVDYPAEDVLLVEDPEQLRALGGDLRGRIVGLLRESARSTQQLSIELGIPKGTVGHHLKVLEKAGLIRVVHERKVRAVTEKFYGRVARLFVFHIEDLADVRSAGASTLRDAAFQIERTSGETAAWGLVLSRLTPKDAKRFGRRVDRLFEDFRVSDAPEGVPHRLVMAYFASEPRDA